MVKRLNQKDLQSLRTHELLREAISKVIAEKGLDAFTIKDICDEANVAVGTFYKYYKGKDEVINNLLVIDDYFETTVAPKLVRGSAVENLLLFAKGYAVFSERYAIQVSQQILKSRLSFNKEEKYTKRDRVLFHLLDQIFLEGQHSGEFNHTISHLVMADMFMILLRGYSFNRSVYNGAVSFVDGVDEHFPLWIKAFE